jgi:hypothetical protein
VSDLETAAPSTHVQVPLAPFASASAVTPPPGVDTGAPRWRSLTGLTQALCVLAVAAGVVALGAIAASVNRLVADRPSEADGPVVGATLAFLAVAIAMLVVMIVWTWRAATNQVALGRDHPRLEPGWAIAAWLIPLGNAVLPVLVMQDLWRGSDALTLRGDMRWRIGARSALVGWWWGCLVASFLVVGPRDDGDEYAIVARCFAIAAAVLLVLVVRKLAARQAATLVAQQAAWAARVAATSSAR